jgi:hypothetical protein
VGEFLVPHPHGRKLMVGTQTFPILICDISASSFFQLIHLFFIVPDALLLSAYYSLFLVILTLLCKIVLQKRVSSVISCPASSTAVFKRSIEFYLKSNW